MDSMVIMGILLVLTATIMVSVGLVLGFIGGMLMGTDKKSIKSYWNRTSYWYNFEQLMVHIGVCNGIH